jgi:hypothetical protein
MQVPKDFDIISIYVATGSDVKFDYLGRIQPDGSVPLPATLAIVEPDDPTSQVHIRITAFQDTNPGAKARVVRDVLTTVPHERTVLLSLPLSFLDDGSGVGTLPAQYVPVGSGLSSGTAPEGPTQFDPTDPSNIQTPLCDFTQGLTSVYGQCMGALLDSSTLPAYGEAEAGTQAQDGGTCFDVTACFAGATLVSDVSSCSFPLAEGASASNLNLALATSTTGACIASIDECLVPLVEDPNAGWTLSGGTVTLAPGACTKAQQAGVQLFQATSGACPAMALTALVCEPTNPNSGGSLPEGGDATVSDAGDASDATVEAEAESGDASVDSTTEADGPAPPPYLQYYAAPILLPGLGGGLDIYGGVVGNGSEGWNPQDPSAFQPPVETPGRTITLAQANAILGPPTGDGGAFYGVTGVSWGEYSQISVLYSDASLVTNLDLCAAAAADGGVMAGGYAGALTFASADKSTVYSVRLDGTPIHALTNDGGTDTPVILYWGTDAGAALDTTVNELYEALRATLDPSWPQLPDCESSAVDGGIGAACKVGNNGTNGGYLFFQPLHLSIYVSTTVGTDTQNSAPGVIDMANPAAGSAGMVPQPDAGED